MRKLLLPISLLYSIVLTIRHKLYDWHLLKSVRFKQPVICIGNLCLGGSGKTPHTEYLIRLLSKDFKVCVISRGYGRRTKGFVLADSGHEEIGDEPMQYHLKFPEIGVAVDEDRAKAIRRMLKQSNPPQVFILDDALQHRKIDAGLNILLTEYDHPYFSDCLVPSGTLRDVKSAARRADIVVVTKSPANLGEKEKEVFKTKLDLDKTQRLYFSHLTYGQPIPLNDKARNANDTAASEVLVFSGIANPDHLVEHLKATHDTVCNVRFSDHHNYSEKDIDKILGQFATLNGESKIIMTTEKDAARLAKTSYFCKFESVPLFAQPIQVEFNSSDIFNKEIESYVRTNSCNG